MEDIIPFPWPHVLFSMKTLLSVAARLYDSPHSQVACYSIDPRTGLKKPNPYLDEGRWATFLNHITIRGFNRVLRQLPFRVVHQERIGFGGRTFRIGRLVRFLAKVPFVDDFFCSALYTVLEKPTGSPEGLRVQENRSVRAAIETGDSRARKAQSRPSRRAATGTAP
jgi:hypothetical protein